MKTLHRPTIRRVSGIAALALTMSVGLAACGDDADSDSNGSDDSNNSSDTSDDAGSDTSDPMDGDAEAASEPFGEACDQIPTDGAGSLEGMTLDPVATAAGNNPLLEQLVGAVGLVPGLGDELNNAEALTVFAPYNDAFEAVPPETMDALTADPEGMLAPVLGYHVLPERLEPADIAGTHPTFPGVAEVTVTGDETGMTVGANGTEANVLCGGIQTANATVYVIDAVLIPPTN